MMTASEVLPLRPIVALSIGACGSAAALRVCDPLLPYLAARYDAGLGAAAQTVTGFAVAYGVLQLAYGPIGDRYGKYRVVMFATIASALTSIACALASSLPALVLARIAAGATAGALIPLSLAWIGDVVPYDRRQPVLARFLIGQMLGVALGQVLGGIGADYLGPGPVFVVLAVWFAASAGLMWRFAPARPERLQPATRGIQMRFVSVLQVRWARLVLLTVFAEGVLLVGALAFVPTHLHRTHGVPLTASASVVMLFALGGLVYATVSPMLVRRWGEAGLAMAGGIVLAACFVGLAFGPLLAIAVVACPVAGLGFYMLHNTLQVNATQMAPAERGSSIALFACMLFIGHSVGVTLAGVLAERVGTGPVIAGSGVLLFALGSAFAWARRRRA
jgi:predicted MFS family arabinose efflux permease